MPSSPLTPVGVRELRSNVAALLRRAGSGERVIVTVDGRPVAQLGPLTPDDANGGVTLWDLAGAGLIEPPRRHDHPPAPRPKPIPADVRTERLLDHVRGR
jgi:prevent-host-death family protein